MEINQYAVTASEMKDLSFLDIDQYVSAGVYQSQKVPVSLVKALMLSENIEQTNVVAAQALVAGSDLVSLKTYILDDADGGGRIIKVLAAAGITNQFYQYGIDVTSGEIGTYDINTDVFTLTSGNALIVETSAAALASLQSGAALSLTTIYIVTDATYRIALQAEAPNKLGANGTIIDLTYSGSVYYDLATNTIVNGTMSDIDGNTWNGCLPTDVILGADCFNNTFGQGSNGFTFGDDLKNVTIEAGITGADYSNTTTYAFLYNKTYSSTIFQSGGINYHRYFDIANDRIEITDLATPANITYIGGGGPTPDIQQVLDIGNTSTTSIKIDSGTGNYVDVKDSNIIMEDSSGNALTIYPDSITIQNPSFGAGTIKATALANNVFFELPNKAAGTFTFAMTSDITGGVASVSSGTNISVDNTDPANPIINSLADRYSTSSITSNSISNGSKTFTVDADLAYIPLQEVLIVNDPAHHMHATVTSYSGTTLVVDVKHNTGSGTFIVWVINLDGVPVDAITGVGTANEIAYFTAGQVIASLPVATYPSLTELSYVKGVTSAIQTQLNAIVKPISSVGNGTAVTGVIVNTYSKGLLIPANSRTANDVVQVDFQVTKTGAAGNVQLRFYWNTTNNLSGSPILLGTSPNGAALWLAFSRLLSIEVANGTGNATKVAPTSMTTLATGYGTSTTTTSTVAIDWTANGYLICSILNSNAADSSVCHMLKLN